MPQRLTEALVKRLEPPASGATTVWDSEPKGFGVRVFAPTSRNPDGSRSFFFNYRFEGVERRFTIGAHPDWSVEAARAEAKALRRRVDSGADPVAEARSRREAPTVRELAERYRRDHLPRKAKRSQREDWSIIEREILPRLGDRKVADVHHGDMEALHKAITDRGAPVRANRVLACASKMFSLSLKPLAGEDKPWRDQAQGNPCRGVERNPEEGCERFFSTAEIAALSDALDAYSDTPAANCVRLIMLTGCRPSEAMLATWEQFDAEPGYWVKPSAHTKIRRVQRFPLSPAALELIARVRKQREKAVRGKGSPYVFPGQKANAPLKQLRSTWEALSAEASVRLWRGSADADLAKLVTDLEKGLKRLPTVAECREEAERRRITLLPALTDARLYDARHTFASVGAGGGLSLQIIGRLLGHTQARTTQRYSHLADDPLKEAAAKIAGAIVNAGKAGGAVTPMKSTG